LHDLSEYVTIAVSLLSVATQAHGKEASFLAVRLCVMNVFCTT